MMALSQSKSRGAMTVEGWRGINHSFALVNQFQLLEMVKRTELSINHVDMPFHLQHWSRATNGPGFHDVDEAILSKLTNPEPDLTPDWTYRIYSPMSLAAPKYGSKLAIFLVTELGLDERTFASNDDITQFKANDGIIITPSRWSRERIVDWGFEASSVHVVPHGASADYFFPLPKDTIKSQRLALGFREDEVLLMNVGAAIWNKGIDILLHGFALARKQRKDLRLVFKDQRNTYGISGDTYVKSTLSGLGLLSDDVLNAITLIPANLTMDQMNAMYGIADCYVSPYRAEGFNMPVLEAMTCGTPVIATAGGATEDFIAHRANKTITSTLYTNAVVQGTKICAYREPSLEHFVELLMNIRHKPMLMDGNLVEPPADNSWRGPVDQLLALMN